MITVKKTKKLIERIKGNEHKLQQILSSTNDISAHTENIMIIMNQNKKMLELLERILKQEEKQIQDIVKQVEEKLESELSQVLG